MQIIKLNNSIEQGMMAGKDISGHQGQLGWCWEVLQSLHALMINSQVNLNALPRDQRPKAAPRQSLVQRLKVNILRKIVHIYEFF